MVLGATLAGLAGVFAFHTHTANGVLAPLPAAGTPGPGGGRSAGAAGGSGKGGSSSSTTSPTTSPTSSVPKSSVPSSSATTAPTNTSATGTAIQYGYGVLAVRVTVSGGRITQVTVPELRTAESYSQTLANQVIPMLRSEVLSAQSARINGIAGATYTAEAFAQSLQAALNKAHFG